MERQEFISLATSLGYTKNVSAQYDHNDLMYYRPTEDIPFSLYWSKQDKDVTVTLSNDADFGFSRFNIDGLSKEFIDELEDEFLIDESYEHLSEVNETLIENAKEKISEKFISLLSKHHISKEDFLNRIK